MSVSREVNSYRVPLGGPVDVLVLEYQGNFYSFGSTCRSSRGVWEEVKDRLETLDMCNEYKHEIVIHFYEKFNSED